MNKIIPDRIFMCVRCKFMSIKDYSAHINELERIDCNDLHGKPTKMVSYILEYQMKDLIEVIEDLKLTLDEAMKTLISLANQNGNEFAMQIEAQECLDKIGKVLK